MLNRDAVILKYKDPAIRWINDADPYLDDPRISGESLVNERTVYLISEADSDGEHAVENWIRKNFKALFEAELGGWYKDPNLWPKKRTLKLFQEWFEVEYHSVIEDTVGGAIYDDEA